MNITFVPLHNEQVCISDQSGSYVVEMVDLVMSSALNCGSRRGNGGIMQLDVPDECTDDNAKRPPIA